MTCAHTLIYDPFFSSDALSCKFVFQERRSENVDSGRHAPQPALYHKLVEQLETIGWNRLIFSLFKCHNYRFSVKFSVK